MAEFTIRRGELGDLTALVEFNQGIALETEGKELDPETLKSGLRRILENDQLGFYLVAVSNEQVVGCLMVTFEWSDWRNATFWWVQSVYVHADFRRQGIYRGLYKHVKTLAQNEKVCGFRLYVEKENHIAQQTYETMGMRETIYKMYEQKP